MNEVYPKDFNMAITENGETLVRVSEINEMIRKGVFALNREKMNDYHFHHRDCIHKTSMLQMQDRRELKIIPFSYYVRLYFIFFSYKVCGNVSGCHQT